MKPSYKTDIQILEGKQPLRQEVLLKILENNEFFPVHESDGHITVQHKRYPAIDVTITKNSSSPLSQNLAAKKLRDVMDLDRAAEMERLKNLEANVTARGTTIVETAKSLPDDMECVPYLQDQVIVRSKEWPQIGEVTLDLNVMPAINRITQDIRTRAGEFSSLLKTATPELELDVKRDADGTLRVEQPFYASSIILPPYNGGPKDSAIKALTGLTAEIAFIDGDLIPKVKNLVEVFKEAGQMISVIPMPSGQTQYTLEIFGAFEDKKSTERFVVSPHFRIAVKDFVLVNNALFHFRFGAFGDENYIRSKLRDYHGFIVRPDKSVKGRLVCTHPFFPDFRKNIPDSSALPDLRHIYAKMENADNQYDAESALLDMMQAYAQQQQALVELGVFANELDPLFENLRDRFSVVEKKLNLRFSDSTLNAFVALNFGSMMTLTFTSPFVPEKIEVRIIRVRNPAPTPTTPAETLAHPEDIGRLEAIIARRDSAPGPGEPLP